MIKLKTERLFIRPVNAKDNGAIFKYRSDKETNKYQGWIPQTREDVDVFIEKTPTKINEVGTWFQFVLILTESEKIVGDVGVHFIDEMQAEIGCTLAKDYHGKGLATEALQAVIDYLFQNLQKHRIIGSIDPENIQSMRLVERLGFRKEAHFKESLFLVGKWVDDIIYAILQKEWLK